MRKDIVPVDRRWENNETTGKGCQMVAKTLRFSISCIWSNLHRKEERLSLISLKQDLLLIRRISIAEIHRDRDMKTAKFSIDNST